MQEPGSGLPLTIRLDTGTCFEVGSAGQLGGLVATLEPPNPTAESIRQCAQLLCTIISFRSELQL
jgi:hypothetical protein